MIIEEKLWILKSKGAKSAFAGNSGYADKLEQFYLYDTTVKNHDKIKPGDYVLLVNKHHILGSARIEEIQVEENIPKQRFRCPECNTQEHYSRLSVSPKYKCRNKHEFETPLVEDITVTQFRAHYNNSFRAAAAKLSVKTLEGHYINRNVYYSIQQADPVFISGGAADRSIQVVAKAPARKERKISFTLPKSAYVPSGADDRTFSTGRLGRRSGQDEFRAKLFNFYGEKCMVSDCEVAVAIEASHICPYRGKQDNHPENGVLLRRDLHVLYDRDLIGIEPDALRITLSASLRESVYLQYDGQVLSFDYSFIKPSTAALRVRWQAFLQQEATR